MAPCDSTHVYALTQNFALSYPSSPILTLPYPLCSLIQKPVVIAVRFMSITRSAAAVRTRFVCLTLNHSVALLIGQVPAQCGVSVSIITPLHCVCVPLSQIISTCTFHTVAQQQCIHPKIQGWAFIPGRVSSCRSVSC